MELYIQNTKERDSMCRGKRCMTRRQFIRSPVLGDHNGEARSNQQNSSEFHIMKLGLHPRHSREPREDFKSQ